MHTHYLNQKEKINTTREGAEGKGRIKRKCKICESGGKKEKRYFWGVTKKDAMWVRCRDKERARGVQECLEQKEIERGMG